MDNNNTKKDVKITYVPEIQKLVTDHYLEAKEEAKNELLEAVVLKEDAIEVLNRVITEFDHDIEQCKKYFCTISLGSIHNIFQDYCGFEVISIEMMPVRVTLDNETKMYVDIEIYADGHFIVGREYNEMYDANPSEGPEYNIIFNEDTQN